MSLNLLVRQRAAIRASVTRQYNDSLNYNNYTVPHRSNLMMTIEGYKGKLEELNDSICKLKFSDDSSLAGEEFQKEFDDCEAYTDRMHECIAQLTALNDPSSSNSANGTNGGVSVPPQPSHSLLKSPTAPLPSFSSKEGENFELFIEQFEDTISRYNYPSYDKLLLLKQQISGKALYLIDSLEPQKQTYVEAVGLLRTALASRDVQVFNIIKQMHDLRLSYSDEPFKFIGQIKKIINAFKYLNVTIEDIMQYFVLLGLNDSFRRCLVLITNNNHPSLDKIIDNFFRANERYQVEQEKFKSKNRDDRKFRTDTLITNVVASKFDEGSNPFRICSLCPTHNDHSVNKCVKYPNARNKIERLKAINGCCICANKDHLTSNCKFKLRRGCSNCNESHFTFLCPSIPDKNVRNVSSNSAIIYTMHNVSNFDCIVPTFSCYMSKGLTEIRLRGLKDTGSQSNLICEYLLNDIDYEIINPSVNLQINGINDSKSYVSKLVQVNLRLGEEYYSVPFLTIPKIDTKMKLPGLSNVITAFETRGYHLADEELSDSDDVSNIQIILGSGSTYCFNYYTVHFGRSVFYQTQFGVMLDGSVSRMLVDFPELSKTDHVDTFSAALNACIDTAPHIEQFMSTGNDIIGLTNTKSITGTHIINDDSVIAANYNDKDYSGKASDADLSKSCVECLNIDDTVYNDESIEHNDRLVRYLLDTCTRNKDGRVIMPLLWNDRVKHLLACNFNLAKSILYSNLKKLKDSENKLAMIDDTMKTLLNMEIIEPVHDIENFVKENPTCSFLAHMPIFKLDKETTKCRNVFMSNLAEKSRDDRVALSHNQCMFSGPNLNAKLATALFQLRFNKFVLTFDICKAFLQIELLPHDTNKLLFLWHKDVKNNDFSLQAYRNLRLSFGLRCSPCILMVTLYKLLVEDAYDDSEQLKLLKKQIYSNIYMDNGSISFDTNDEVLNAYNMLPEIFSPYKFDLQQYCTNADVLKDIIDQKDSTVALLGLLWHTEHDTLQVRRCVYDETADTPRKVLKNQAEKFDPCNFELPIYNRSKLFLHELQSEKNMKWDHKMNEQQQREWLNICRQLNNSTPIAVPRFIGSIVSDYDIVCFTDSSGSIYGCVVYLKDRATNKCSFLTAKNHVIGRSLHSKSIPSLEFNAIVLGTETSLSVLNDLSGVHVVSPIRIKDIIVYSDSLVCLHWINSAINDLAKLTNLSVFVRNRLNHLIMLCDSHPVTYTFVDGINNPADLTTRIVSPRKFSSSNYLTGPDFLREESHVSRCDILCVTVPCVMRPSHDVTVSMVGVVALTEHLFPLSRFSSFTSTLNVYKYVILFISKLKHCVSRRRNESSSGVDDVDIHNSAINLLIRIDQSIHFPELVSYFNNSVCSNKEIPSLVTQFNLYIDKNDLIRVGSKVSTKVYVQDRMFPIFLSKVSRLTELLIWHQHIKLKHAGVYATLSELRQSYWVCSGFSVVKRVLQECIICRRYNARTLKLNQSDYKDWRIDPSSIPYSDVFIDHMGPFKVRDDTIRYKVYVLVITCLYTRAINLKICRDLSTETFLRSFQMHTFEWGLPRRVFSDLGSSLVAGANTIKSMFNDVAFNDYFVENNIKAPEFEHYYKGCSSLGSVVEICVKLTKRLIHASIKNNALSFSDFEFLIGEVVHIVNRRPVAFQECVRDFSGINVTDPLTPEQLLHGYRLPSANVIPALEDYTDADGVSDPDFDPAVKVSDMAAQLRKVRNNLRTVYNSEFVPKLIEQATNRQSRYKPVKH